MYKLFRLNHVQLCGSGLATVLSAIWVFSGGGLEALIAFITSLTLFAVTVIKERSAMARLFKPAFIWIGSQLLFDERRLLADSSTSIISSKELGHILVRYDFYTYRLKQLTILIILVWAGLSIYNSRSHILSVMANAIEAASVKTESTSNKAKAQTDKKNASHEKKSSKPNNSVTEKENTPKKRTKRFF